MVQTGERKMETVEAWLEGLGEASYCCLGVKILEDSD